MALARSVGRPMRYEQAAPRTSRPCCSGSEGVVNGAVNGYVCSTFCAASTSGPVPFPAVSSILDAHNCSTLVKNLIIGPEEGPSRGNRRNR